MFSEREQQIIKVIGRSKMNYKEIAKQVFGNSNDRPMDANITVSNSITRIIKKCEHYKLKWTFTKGRDNNRVVIKRTRR